MMTEEDREILNIFAEKLRRYYPDMRIWAFGSRVRGRVEWDADLDVCVVLPRINRESCKKIRDIAWQIGYENDRVITTIIFDRDQFEDGPMSESTIVENIRREGIAA
jgi:predicted nucleotidyltransferase